MTRTRRPPSPIGPAEPGRAIAHRVPVPRRRRGHAPAPDRSGGVGITPSGPWRVHEVPGGLPRSPSPPTVVALQPVIVPKAPLLESGLGAASPGHGARGWRIDARAAAKRVTRRAALLALPVLLAGPIVGPTPLRAEGDQPGKVIAGWVEKVVIPRGNATVKAKLDSGAETSSIHAEAIERFEKDGERWARFTLVLEDVDDEVHRVPTEARVARRIAIKDQDGPSDRRVVVELELCMDGRTHPAQFSLADRGSFLYPVLLGRRFLAGRFLIDPDQTFLTQAACAKPPDDDADGGPDTP